MWTPRSRRWPGPSGRREPAHDARPHENVEAPPSDRKRDMIINDGRDIDRRQV
jgi:hypothetical protein